ncbi:hypothetical protein [Mesorhizobium sp. M0816]|uniref:hypothetical protein n=1 Tax=Mesorhizobium sp. M0816 TaxID=2957006 RepID=UPI00333B5A81
MRFKRALQIVGFFAIWFFGGSAQIQANGTVPSIPEILNCSNGIFGGNWPFSWRAVEEKCISRVTSQTAKEFIDWNAKGEEFTEDTGALYLFIWARLIDKNLATPLQFDERTKNFIPITRSLTDSYVGIYGGIEKLQEELKMSLAQEGGGYANSLYAIRLLGLVPIGHARPTILFLKSLVDLDTNTFKVTGQYGEEIVEMQALLDYRASTQGR